jgi:hypothetical protein
VVGRPSCSWWMRTLRELYEILEGLPLWEQVEVEARRMQGLEELEEPH